MFLDLASRGRWLLQRRWLLLRRWQLLRRWLLLRRRWSRGLAARLRWLPCLVKMIEAKGKIPLFNPRHR